MLARLNYGSMHMRRRQEFAEVSFVMMVARPSGLELGFFGAFGVWFIAHP